MKIFKNFIRNSVKTGILFFVICAVLSFTACSNDDNSTAPVPKPSLSDISPTSGPRATVVSINGNNFGTNTDAVTVFFNEVEAVVQSVENNKITALVPPGTSTGVVKVVIAGTTLTGPEFTYVLTIEVSTLAGSTVGFADGMGANAQFDLPERVAVDVKGTLFVTDTRNHKIRKITSDGTVSTLAGSTEGFADGIGANAQFDSPIGIAVDAEGTVYVADAGNHRIRKIMPDGTVSTLAGSTEGDSNGGVDPKFSSPRGVAVDVEGTIYVADRGNHKIKKITPQGVVSTQAGSTQGFADGMSFDAQFYFPTGIAVDAQRNVYVGDRNNHKIRKITPNDVVSTVAGSTEGFVDATGVNAQFNFPSGVAVDALGTIYVADFNNHSIRKITPDGEVSTLAGSIAGFVNGTGANAQFDSPIGIAVDTQGAIYVVDFRNYKIRKITQE